MQYYIGFAIHWLESTMNVHVFPILNPLPLPSPFVKLSKSRIFKILIFSVYESSVQMCYLISLVIFFFFFVWIPWASFVRLVPRVLIFWFFKWYFFILRYKNTISFIYWNFNYYCRCEGLRAFVFKDFIKMLSQIYLVFGRLTWI